MRRRPSSFTSKYFCRLLSNPLHLAEYVRKLDYNFNNNEFARWSFLSPVWLPMFKKLVNLQHLSISYRPSKNSEPGRKLDWMSLSERKALLPLLHLPTLTSISLSRIKNFALADFAGCVNLKELQIQALTYSTGASVGKILEVLPSTQVMLERLAIDEVKVKRVQQLCNARRPDGKPIIDFSSLKNISARVAKLDSMTKLFVMWRNLRKINLTSMSLLCYFFTHLMITLILQLTVN